MSSKYNELHMVGADYAEHPQAKTATASLHRECRDKASITVVCRPRPASDAYRPT